MNSIPCTISTTLPSCPEQLVEILPEIIEPSPAVGRFWSDCFPRFGKRVIDVVGSGLGFVFLSPVLLLIAVLIRRDSKGPALFVQTRLGQEGRPFQLLKFRTMVVDAEARIDEIEHLNESEGGVLFKVERDPRVTRLGHILRKYCLDEFPQLINVFKGEMSLVGPRPLQLRDSALLAQIDPEGFIQRLKVPSGMTGLWQASDRTETGFTHMMKLDLEYIENWSVWSDLILIVQTARLFFPKPKPAKVDATSEPAIPYDARDSIS